MTKPKPSEKRSSFNDKFKRLCSKFQQKTESEFLGIQLILRGDSGFATPELYELLEDFDVYYVIRLKLNATLSACSKAADDEFYAAYGTDYSKSHSLYHYFIYQAGSWSKSRRVACRIERNADEQCPRHTFMVVFALPDGPIIVVILPCSAS